MILVTGATGKVGHEVVRQLAGAGTPVRALVRDPVGASSIRLPGVEIVTGDLARPDTLVHALDGIERVFLLTPAHPDMLRTAARSASSSRSSESSLTTCAGSPRPTS